MPTREMLRRLLAVLGGCALFASGCAMAAAGSPLGTAFALLAAAGVALEGWEAVKGLRGGGGK
jgi:hypothetical protein